MIRTGFTFLAWISGFFPVSNPFRQPENLHWFIFHPIVLWSLLLAFGPAAIQYGLIVSPEFQRLWLTMSFLSQLRATLFAINVYAQSIVARTAAVWYCAETVQLLKELCMLREYVRSQYAYDTVQLPYKKRLVLLWSLLVLSVGVLTAHFVHTINASYYQGERIGAAMRILSAFTGSATNASPGAALMFIGFVSVELMRMHWCFMRLIVDSVRNEGQSSNKKKSNVANIAWVAYGTYGTRKTLEGNKALATLNGEDDLWKQFQFLIQAFRKYNCISGWYTLALAVYAATGLLVALAEPVVEKDSTLTGWTLASAIGMVIFMWVLGNFGDFVQGKFTEHHQDALLEICAMDEKNVQSSGWC